MNKKKISLVVLNYNGLKHLKEYFTSVYNQSLLPDEVIMMDNLSVDGSREFVKKHFPKVKIITEDTYNTGTANGSNVGISHATGEYIICQSNDIRLDKNCVKGLVAAMDSDKKIGIVSSVLVWYHKNKDGIHVTDAAGGNLDKFGFGMANRSNKRLEEIPEQEEVFFTFGGSFMVRKKAFQESGGFDDRFFTLNDDLDFSWRVKLMGYKVIYTKKSIVYHKGHGTIIQRKWGQKRYWAERNSIRSFLKNAELGHLLRSLPMYITLLIAEAFYFLYRGHADLFFADVKAGLWNIWNLPDTLKQRHIIQSKRRKNNVMKLMKKTSFKLDFFNVFKHAL